MRIDTSSGFGFLMVMATTILAIYLAGGVYAAPPLPVHTVEGVGGGAITPMAYLVNPEPEGAVFGKPSGALTYVNMGQKSLNAFTLTETIGGRIEFGYAANRLGLGSLPMAIRNDPNVGVDIQCSDLWLHHFNMRMLMIKENTCLGGLAMPAVTAGVHFKVNDGIRDIDQRLGGALSGIGFDRQNSVDYTLTATRTIPPEVLGRPLIVTAGLRLTQGAQLGLLGFGDEYHATFEGNVAYLPFDWLVLAYEFRQKPDPYGQIPGLIGDEDHWHAFDAIFILSEHTAFTAGYGNFATIANTEENGVWWLQLKYEL